MVEPEPAQELADLKAQNILSTGADILATSNPGCLLQIASALKRAGRQLPAVHMVELVDASMRGVVPAKLQRH